MPSGLWRVLIRMGKDRLTVAAVFVGSWLEKILLPNHEPNYRIFRNDRTVIPK